MDHDRRPRRRLKVDALHTADGRITIPAAWTSTPLHETAAELVTHHREGLKSHATAELAEKLAVPCALLGHTLHAYGSPFATTAGLGPSEADGGIDHLRPVPMTHLFGATRRSSVLRLRRQLANHLPTGAMDVAESLSHTLPPAAPAVRSTLARVPFPHASSGGLDPFEEPSILAQSLVKPSHAGDHYARRIAQTQQLDASLPSPSFGGSTLLRSSLVSTLRGDNRAAGEILSPAAQLGVHASTLPKFSSVERGGAEGRVSTAPDGAFVAADGVSPWWLGTREAQLRTAGAVSTFGASVGPLNRPPDRSRFEESALPEPIFGREGLAVSPHRQRRLREIPFNPTYHNPASFVAAEARRSATAATDGGVSNLGSSGRGLASAEDGRGEGGGNHRSPPRTSQGGDLEDINRITTFRDFGKQLDGSGKRWRFVASELAPLFSSFSHDKVFLDIWNTTRGAATTASVVKGGGSSGLHEQMPPFSPTRPRAATAMAASRSFAATSGSPAVEDGAFSSRPRSVRDAAHGGRITSSYSAPTGARAPWAPFATLGK